MRLIPKGLVLVVDAKSDFNDVDRLKAMFAEMDELSAIRGSEIMPES